MKEKEDERRDAHAGEDEDMFRRRTSSDPKWMFASEELATSVCKKSVKGKNGKNNRRSDWSVSLSFTNVAYL